MINNWVAITLLQIFIFLVTPSFAADKVVIIPLGGSKVEVSPDDIVNCYIKWSGGTEAILLTVPSNKLLVLTDIVFSDTANITFTLHQGSEAKFSGTSNNTSTQHVNFTSGLIWQPDTQLRLTVSGNNNLGLTLSGFYVSQ